MEAAEPADVQTEAQVPREGYAVGRVYPPNSYVRGKLTLDEWSLQWVPDNLGMGQKLFDWVDKPLVLSLGDIQSVTLRQVRGRERLVIRADRTYEFTRITPKVTSYLDETIDYFLHRDNGLKAWYEELKPYARSTKPDDAPLAPLIDNAFGVTVLAVIGTAGIGGIAITVLTGELVLASLMAVGLAAGIYFIMDGMRSP